ncbi:muscle M-line assembly protein unc-89-like [Bolinopsis microptera]|uniref:muscle M-line assembly protein unc-89-like n=1 Tax=Bolinopsis microptera TaxID=2820187 RepID=UPI003079C4C2
MLSGDPNCFGHPTKVTFTFSEKCLKNAENPNYPPYASYWAASPYREDSTYNIQSWLAHKMKTQRQKVKLERAVQRAERKLQVEYDKQMEVKQKAADQKFKVWLKNKGFANQSPVMLLRGPHRPETTPSNANLVSVGDSKRPKTARVRSLETPHPPSSQRTKGKLRPRSASASGNRKQITSTLDKKSIQPKPSCKALGQDEYMKMRHLAGKRYKKLKDEKSGFQCEDQLLRKLQDLSWEEKCIKNKMVFSEKEDLDKVKKKALKKGKKKLKFKGDVITVEVEEINSNADVDITFEEVDDKCSDIGCIEREGVDFHIESRETIDLSDKPDEEFCRPITAEPPKVECEIIPAPTSSAPTRPKTAKQRPGNKEGAVKKDSVKEDGKKPAATENKGTKEDDPPTQEIETLVKATEKEEKKKAAAPKEKTSPKKAAAPPKEAQPPVEPKAPKKTPEKQKDVPSTPKKDAAQQPVEKLSQKEDAKSTKAEKVSPPKEAEKQPAEKVSPPKVAEKLPAETVSPPKEAEKLPAEKLSPPKEAKKLPVEKVSPPKEAKKPLTEKETPPKEAKKSPKEAAKPPSEEAPSFKEEVEKVTPNGEVHGDKSSTKEVKTAEADSKIAADSFFDD